MSALEILITEIEHTASLTIEDGSKVTQSKLNAHLRQYGEAVEGECKSKPAGRWLVQGRDDRNEHMWVELVETQYVADEQWPKIGQTLEEVR